MAVPLGEVQLAARLGERPAARRGLPGVAIPEGHLPEQPLVRRPVGTSEHLDPLAERQLEARLAFRSLVPIATLPGSRQI